MTYSANLGLTTVTGFASKICTGISQLLAIYLISSHLGVEQYAAFGLVTSFLAWYMLFDFGVGNSLQNFVSQRVALGLPYLPDVRYTIVVFSVLNFTVGIAAWLLSPFVGPLLLRNTGLDDQSSSELFFVAVMSYSVVTQYGLSQKVLYAEGRGYIANITVLCGTILGVCALALYLLASDTERNLIVATLIYLLPMALANLYLSLRTYIRAKRISGQVSFFTKYNMGQAVQFWTISWMAALVVQVDVLFASQILVTDDLAAYIILSKLFTLLYFLYNSYLTALWPVFSRLYSLGSYAEIRSRIRNSILYGGSASIFFLIFLSLLSEGLIVLMTSGEVRDVNLNLIVAFSILTVIRFFTDIFAVFVQSVGYLKYFLLAIVLQAFVNILIMSFWGIRNGEIGLISSICLSYLMTVSLALPYLTVKLLRHRSDEVLK